MRHYYYDRTGRPISMDEAERLLADGSARQVALTQLSDGGFLSTVHLVVDHSGGVGPLQIFESMKFPEHDCEYYSTEVEAAAGHARILAALAARGVVPT